MVKRFAKEILQVLHSQKQCNYNCAIGLIRLAKRDPCRSTGLQEKPVDIVLRVHLVLQVKRRSKSITKES